MLWKPIVAGWQNICPGSMLRPHPVLGFTFDSYMLFNFAECSSLPLALTSCSQQLSLSLELYLSQVSSPSPLWLFHSWAGCPVCCLLVLWLLVHWHHITSHCEFIFSALGQQQSNPMPLFYRKHLEKWLVPEHRLGTWGLCFYGHKTHYLK
jgi:hypothetical protein